MPTVSVKDINFDKLLDFGIFVESPNEIPSHERHSHRKCYIITNIDPNILNIDVATLVKNVTGKFNKNYGIILKFTSSKTKLKNIKNERSYFEVYLKVEGNFSLSPYLKIQNQDRNYLVGSGVNDRLKGSSGNDKIWGGAGDDWLQGNAGNDWLFGKAGDDKIWGNTGDDRVWGGRGDDGIWGGTGNDVLHGGAGDDELWGGVKNNTYRFNSGNIGHDLIDLFSISEGIDTVEFYSNEQYFITKWDDQKQEVQFYLFTNGVGELPFVYDGKDHITVEGFSKIRKLLIKNYSSSSADELIVHRVTYKIKGQKEKQDFQTLLPKGTKEIFLPTNCELVSLHGPNKRLIHDVIQKTFVDKTPKGKLNALFGVK